MQSLDSMMCLRENNQIESWQIQMGENERLQK